MCTKLPRKIKMRIARNSDVVNLIAVKTAYAIPANRVTKIKITLTNIVDWLFW